MTRVEAREHKNMMINKYGEMICNMVNEMKDNNYKGYGIDKYPVLTMENVNNYITPSKVEEIMDAYKDYYERVYNGYI